MEEINWEDVGFGVGLIGLLVFSLGGFVSVLGFGTTMSALISIGWVLVCAGVVVWSSLGVVMFIVGFCHGILVIQKGLNDVNKDPR
jgi:hypothetical protein